MYDGARSYSVAFTPQSFQAEVMTVDKASSKTWLVLFGAPWSSGTMSFAPVFASLSLKYARDNLAFGEVDVSMWPALAKQLKVRFQVHLILAAR